MLELILKLSYFNHVFKEWNDLPLSFESEIDYNYIVQLISKFKRDLKRLLICI
jgi:hypothetical protein